MNYIADAKETFFENKEHYLTFQKKWKELANNPDITLRAEHFMFYSAIRGRNVLEGFPDRGPKKVYHQGYVRPGASDAYVSLKYAMRSGGTALSEFFDGTISPQVVIDVISMIPAISNPCIYTSKSYEEWKQEYLQVEEAA